MPKDKIVVLSDIHIGTNYKTNWYQKEFHEPYLSAILDHVIQNKDSIQELILLGDIFDFWTYPPNMIPPAFADMLAANPNIFGVNGKLSQVLTALQGRVTYVNGNHDMNVTKNDLDQIPNSDGYKINYCPEPIYYVQTDQGKKIAFTHGHIFTMFNNPYLGTEISPLPVGYYITRSVAYKWDRELKPGQTVADLRGQGAPTGVEHPLELLTKIEGGRDTIVDILLSYMETQTGIREEEPINLPNGLKTTFAEARKLYSNLWSQWVHKGGGGEDGQLVARKSAIADFDGSYIAWFAQQSALTSGSDLIVLGHTHTPKCGLSKGLVNYVNNGFECASKPDISQKTFTFTVVETKSIKSSIWAVKKQQEGTFSIQAYNTSPDSVIVALSEDYSCYIIIDNSQGSQTMTLTETTKNKGHYVVAPPQTILPGQQGKFWLQDYPGVGKLLQGSEGSVTYAVGGKFMTLTYACPVGGFNKCSGANFFTSNDGVKWGKLNKIKEFGYPLHPFFVKFVM